MSIFKMMHEIDAKIGAKKDELDKAQKQLTAHQSAVSQIKAAMLEMHGALKALKDLKEAHAKQDPNPEHTLPDEGSA